MMHRRCFLAAFGASTLNAFQAKEQPPPKTESLMSRILRLTGISATPRGLKGPKEITTGDIWKIAVDGKNKTQEKLTFDGGYRSPVFTPDDQRVLAVRGSNLVWISMRDSSTTPAEHTLPDLVRLIGFETGRGEKSRVVAIAGQKVVLFSPWDGAAEVLEMDQGDEDYARGVLATGALEFNGSLLSVDGAGHELALTRQGKEPVLLAASQKAIYADPALSHDGATVVFVRV